MTRCACGHDFSHDVGNKISNAAVTALLEVLQAKLQGEDLNGEALAYVGFPLEALNRMQLTTLLAILDRLENFLDADTPDNLQPLEVRTVETAAEVFRSWPTGFHRHLELVHSPEVNMQAKGLRGQFKSFYEAFFKSNLPMEEIAFMREAFVEFGEKQWKQAAIHPRLNDGKASNIVGIEGLAKAAGIRPVTARKLVAKGVIPIHSHHPQNGRMLFDLSQQMPFEFARGKSLSLDAAAQLLDIPATVLRAYRARGYYQARCLAKPLSLYHEKDVESLRSDLMKNCEYMQVDDEVSLKTLRKIMLQKLGPPEVKAAFIDAVRKRDILPIGITGKQPGDLLFDARKVKDLLKELSDKLSNTISIEDMKGGLGIKHSMVRPLLQQGLLKATVADNFGIRILENSLHAFASKYLSCRTVAHIKGLAQAEVLKLCDDLKIPCLHLHALPGGAATIFISKCHASLLGISPTMQEAA